MGSVHSITKRCALFSFSLLMLFVAGLGCAAGHARGEGCSIDGDCRPELICFDHECTAPGSCPNHAPVSCGDGSCCTSAIPICCGDGNCYTTPADCKAATCSNSGQKCALSTDCCGDLICKTGTCAAAGPACTKTAQPCSSDTCCAGLTCSRFSLSCKLATGLALGEPCTSNVQCASNQCRGWCTRGCTTNAVCTDVTLCIPTNQGKICAPWCGTGSNTRCSVYGAGTTCQATQDVDGTSQAVCLGN